MSAVDDTLFAYDDGGGDIATADSNGADWSWANWWDTSTSDPAAANNADSSLDPYVPADLADGAYSITVTDTMDAVSAGYSSYMDAVGQFQAAQAAAQPAGFTTYMDAVNQFKAAGQLTEQEAADAAGPLPTQGVLAKVKAALAAATSGGGSSGGGAGSGGGSAAKPPTPAPTGTPAPSTAAKLSTGMVIALAIVALLIIKGKG
jgi:hypothetical protein